MARDTKVSTFLLITMGRPSLILFQKLIATRFPSVSKITKISQHYLQSSAALTWNCSGAESPTFSLKGGSIMESTLMYLTGNDSRLAQDLILALSALFISFFSAETEDENETESINSIQSTGGASEQGSSSLCPPVNDGPSSVQPGEYAETVCPSRKSVIAWLAGRTHSCNRRGSRYIRFRKVQTPRLCPTRNERIPGRSWCGIRTGDITLCPLVS